MQNQEPKIHWGETGSQVKVWLPTNVKLSCMCHPYLSYISQKAKILHLIINIFLYFQCQVMLQVFLLTANDCNTALGPPDVDFTTPCKSALSPQRLEVNWPDGVTQVKSSIVWPINFQVPITIFFLNFRLFCPSKTTIKPFLQQIKVFPQNVF